MKCPTNQPLIEVRITVAICLITVTSLLLSGRGDALFAPGVDATVHQPTVENPSLTVPDYVGAAYGAINPPTGTAFTLIKYALVAIFGLAILGKLSGKLKDNYRRWGYGNLFMYALAGVELVGVVGLFTPYSLYAAFLLLAIMLGAFFTLVRHREPFPQYGMAILATTLLVAFLVVHPDLP